MNILEQIDSKQTSTVTPISLVFLLFLLTIAGCEKFKGCSGFSLFPVSKHLKNVRQPDFIGNWINVKYLSKLKSTQSVIKAQRAIAGLSSVDIKKQYLKNNDIFLVRNLHDGSNAKVHFDREEGKLLVYRNQNIGNSMHNAELFLVKTGDDTLLHLRDIASRKEYKLKKIPRHLENFAEYLNRTLFSGSYLVEKEAESGTSNSSLSFLSNGEIIGHKYLTKYEIWYDFYDDIPQMDIVVFRDRRSKPYRFHWKKSESSLVLYNLASEGRNKMTSYSRRGKVFMILKSLDR